MSGGGETPTKTLWKYNQGAGYLIGEFQNGKLLIEGPDESHIFVTDADGKITQFSYSPSSDEFIDGLKQIFSQYFGEIETVQILIVSGLAIGDDVPNWDSYELLEL